MKHLRFNTIAGVIALAAAPSVFAVDADLAAFGYDEANTAGQITLYTSGATAQDPGIESFFKLNQANNGPCTDGTLFIYKQDPDLNGDIPNRLYVCTANPAIAALGGKTIALFKGSTGGSGNGVLPLATLGRATPTAVPLWDVSVNGASMTCTISTPVAAAGTQAAHTIKTGCTNVTFNTSAARPLEAGFSDLEPARFATNISPNLTAAELATLNAQQVAAVIFGVPVSLNIRNNLQDMTFPAGDPCLANAAARDTAQCQPSLTLKQLSAIFSRNGQYTNWTALKSKTVAGATAATGLASPGITICRRSNTSGTQAVNQTYFFKQNCGLSNAATFAAINGTTVISNGGSPAVMSCLDAANTANTGAIGILSAEFQPGVNGAPTGWRFVKINGYPPCLLDAIRSNYELIGEATMQWRTTLAGDDLALATAIRTRLQSAAAVEDVNNNTAQLDICTDRGRGALIAPFAQNAAATPQTPFCLTAGVGGCVATNSIQSRPVLLSTRNNGTPNSCSAFRDTFPTELTQ